MKLRTGFSRSLHFIALFSTSCFWEPIVSKSIPSIAGPFITLVDSYESCGSENEYTCNIRSSHFNPLKPFEKQTITGNMTATVPMTDNLWVRVTLDLRSNNQWKENAFVLKFASGACSTVKANAPGWVRTVYKLSPERMKSPCVLPKGTFTFDHEPIDWTHPNVPVIHYGQYRVTTTLGEGSVRHQCIRMVMKFIPKPS